MFESSGEENEEFHEKYGFIRFKGSTWHIYLILFYQIITVYVTNIPLLKLI